MFWMIETLWRATYWQFNKTIKRYYMESSQQVLYYYYHVIYNNVHVSNIISVNNFHTLIIMKLTCTHIRPKKWYIIM
jgi:hypothetical protein